MNDRRPEPMSVGDVAVTMTPFCVYFEEDGIWRYFFTEKSARQRAAGRTVWQADCLTGEWHVLGSDQ